MKQIKQLTGTIISFITSTGFAWIGGALGALLVFIFMPKSWFWGVIFGVLLTIFILKNLNIFKPWADKQWTDIIKKFR